MKMKIRAESSLAFPSALKTLRKNRNISQVFMAKTLGVSRQTYLDIETGKTEPRITMVERISAILDVSIHDLINSDRCNYRTAMRNISTEDLFIELMDRISLLKLNDKSRGQKF